MVSGTKMINETSFVTNIEEKNTEKTKNIVRFLNEDILDVLFISGKNTL
jgi:hypothetical protein